MEISILITKLCANSCHISKAKLRLQEGAQFVVPSVPLIHLVRCGVLDPVAWFTEVNLGTVLVHLSHTGGCHGRTSLSSG